MKIPAILSTIFFVALTAAKSATIAFDLSHLTYTQNFNSMGSSLSLPISWEALYNDATPTWAKGQTTVDFQASSGTPTANGMYNWGASGAVDRAIGVLPASGVSGTSSLMACFRILDASITVLHLQYDVEQYYKNNADMYVRLLTGTDGSSWTAIPSGDVGPFPWSATPTYTFASPWSTTKSVDIPLSLSSPGNVYLQFQFAPFTQGVAIDNVSVTATAVPEPSSLCLVSIAAILIPFGYFLKKGKSREN